MADLGDLRRRVRHLAAATPPQGAEDMRAALAWESAHPDAAAEMAGQVRAYVAALSAGDTPKAALALARWRALRATHGLYRV